ncbi:hypothetical protein TorRG33x02_027640, partial [Trema orientale]
MFVGWPCNQSSSALGSCFLSFLYSLFFFYFSPPFAPLVGQSVCLNYLTTVNNRTHSISKAKMEVHSLIKAKTMHTEKYITSSTTIGMVGLWTTTFSFLLNIRGTNN